jgi:hypothetical protein
MRLRFLFAAAALLAGVPSSFAWNDTGHKSVAFIAYSRLTPAARVRVNELLRKHPMFKQFARSFDSTLDERTRFMLFATWPDFIRDDDHFVSTPFADAACKPTGTPGTSVFPQYPGFPDMQRHEDWHFDDVPFSTDGTPMHPACQPNALTEIVAIEKDLADAGTPDAVKSFELPWLLHLVGDVHQPLHASSRFSAAITNGDRGGNLVKLDNGSNLHSLWDQAVGQSTTPEFIALLATAIMDETADADARTPQDWIDESAGIARATAYGFQGAGTKDDPAVITLGYVKQMNSICRKRVAQAGYRLATALNQAFGS